MTSLTLAQAANISQDMLVQGIVLEFITYDLFASQLPFVAADGKALVYTRELTDPKTTVGYLDVAGTVVSSAPTYTQISQPLGRIAGDAEVDGFEQITMSNVNDQRATQIAAKGRGLGRKFREGVVIGTGTFPQFSGINTLVDSSNQWVAASGTTAGASFSFALLDETVDLITVDSNQLFILMEKTLRRKFKALMRALNGGVIETVELGWLNPVTGARESRNVMSYEGIPIYRNDNVAAESTYGATSKYRVTVGAFGEKVGLTGIMPFDNDPGIRVKTVGESETKDATIDRVVMYTGQALYSTKALAQIVNLLGT
jgi:hypothetical protein